MNVSHNPAEVRPVDGKLDLHNSDEVIGDSWLDQLDRGMLAGVTSMDLRGTQITAAALMRLLGAATALQELNLEDLRLANEILPAIADSPVRKLVVGGNRINDEGLMTFASPHLESLSVSKTGVTDAGLRKLTDNLPALRSLDLSYLHGRRTGQITDRGIEALVGVAALEHLYLDRTKITDAALKTISKLGLLLLSLDKTDLTDVGLRKLRCNRLQSLSIAFTCIPDIGRTGLSDAALQNLDLPALQRLNLSNSFAIVGTGIPKLRLPALRELDLSRTKVSGPGFESDNLRNLIALRLQSTGISDSGLGYINAPALQSLDVSFGQQDAITDAGLDSLMTPRFGRSVLFPALKRLGVYYKKVSPEAIARLREHYPELKVER
jgi:Leucine-rich repeat (LRR) protein